MQARNVKQITTGETLRHLRGLTRQTLVQVAKGADTSVAYLSKVERGQLNPTDEYVAKITGYLSNTLYERAA